MSNEAETVNMIQACEPRSDQLNADDLIAGSRTVTVREVRRGNAEQKVVIELHESPGKPYKPCKSMCRVMVQLWGPDASEYTGRRMTLYRDDSVTWGGMAVGGIRISHVSHIDGNTRVILTTSKGKRKAFTILPLADEPEQPASDPATPAPAEITTWPQWFAAAGIDAAALQSHMSAAGLPGLTELKESDPSAYARIWNNPAQIGREVRGEA